MFKNFVIYTIRFEIALYAGVFLFFSLFFSLGGSRKEFLLAKPKRRPAQQAVDMAC